MNQYFDEIVDSLSINELSILGVLHDEQIDTKFKSMRRSKLREFSKLTVAEFRKAVYKLEAAILLEIVTGEKEHKIFITEFGKHALSDSMKKIEKENDQNNNKSKNSPIIKTRTIKSFGSKRI